MRPHPLMYLAVLLMFPHAGAGQGAYEIPGDSIQVSKPYLRTSDNKIVYDVSFQLKRTAEGDDTNTNFVVFRENGAEVHRLELEKVRSGSLTTVLALDVSGSMKRNSSSGRTKLQEAQGAARIFLDQLPERADTGLILFDHLIKKDVLREPVRDPGRMLEHRAELGGIIDAATPDGGTAYLDAAHAGLEMLAKSEGDRAVVLMTDGIDLNSKKKAEDVIQLANELRVPVHIIGVGDPSTTAPVATVLVLDASNSMKGPASRGSKLTKFDALRDATSRFFDLMRPGAEVGLLPFHRTFDKPKEYHSDKEKLKKELGAVKLALATMLYDAIDAGLDSVDGRPDGVKRRLIAMTDGMDTRSKVRPEGLIKKARAKKIPIDAILFGPKTPGKQSGASAIMKKLADDTGGRFLHSETETELVRHFEELSLDIHGDGIDEEALKALAAGTGGRYFPARDASELKLLFGNLASELKSRYQVTFPSLNQKQDGTVSVIEIAVEDSEGRLLSNVGERERDRFGLVVADMNYLVYLVLLALLLGLLWLPNGLRRAA